MAHQTVFVDVLARQSVVATLHGERVVPDDASHVNLLVQVFVPLAGIEPIFVRPPDFHLPSWFAMYCFTTANETAPAVEMNLERVYKLGSLLFMNGNSSRMACAVHPLICPTTLLIPILGSTSKMR